MLDGGPAGGVNTGPYDWTQGLVIDHRTNRQLPRRMFDVCIADAWWNLGGCGDWLRWLMIELRACVIGVVGW